MTTALTIAGSDPTGGAGIQQDLRTFGALGVWGLSVVTATTVQDTSAVHRWEASAPGLVEEQIEALARDVRIDAAKTGMLPTAAVVEAVVRALAAHPIDSLVVDPVMMATTGAALAGDDAVEALAKLLIPRALLVTPNAEEATRLSGIDVVDAPSQVRAARAIRALGARAVLVKGGHLPPQGGLVTDVLLIGDGEPVSYGGEPVGPERVHGTGCVLSAAVTAGLARGEDLAAAVGLGKRTVHAAIAGARALGKGIRVADPREAG